MKSYGKGKIKMIKKRYKIISTLLSMLMVVSIALSGCAGKTDNTVQNNQNSQSESSVSDMEKTLIIYYSYSGTTKKVAETLRELTQGTLYEISLAEPYTGSSNDVSDHVFKERGDKKMPEIAGELPDIEEYDRVLIGTPVWNNSMANPIFSLLEKTDFGGKPVALFWTYITNEGNTEKDFEKNIQNANVLEGLSLRSVNGMSEEKLNETLTSWINKIK